MNFKDQIEKYSKGELTAEERAQMEIEIEKFKALEMYFVTADSFEYPEQGVSRESANETVNFDPSSAHDNSSAQDKLAERTSLNASIQKKVNRKLLKIASIVGIVVAILVLSINFALPKIVDLAYYNPNQVADISGNTDLFFDLKSFVTLTQPGFSSSFIHAEAKGYGRYKLESVSRDLFSKASMIQSGGIDQNLMLLTTPRQTVDLPKISTYFSDDYEVAKEFYMMGDPVQTLKYLKELSKVAYVSMFIRFDSDLTLETFEEMKKNNPSIDVNWVGIRTQATYQEIDQILGFNPEPNSSFGSKILWDRYPYFELMDWRIYAVDGKSPQEKPIIEGYQAHFNALLSYVADREADYVVGMYSGLTSKVAKDAIAYTDKNGCQVMGMLVQAEASALIKFLEAELNTDNNANANRDNKINSRIYETYIERVLVAQPRLMYREKEGE